MYSIFIKLHIAVLIGGFTGLFGRLVSLDAFWIVYFRLLIGGGFILLYLMIAGKLRNIGLRYFISGGILGSVLACHLVMFYVAIKLSNVSIGVVSISTIGFFVALIEPVVQKSRFSITDFGYSLLAICGVVLIFGFEPRYRMGITAGIICALLSAVYSIFNRTIAVRCDNYSLVCSQMAGGFIFMTLLLPVYYCFTGSWSLYFSASDAFYLLLAGTVCTAGMYLLQLQILQKLSAFTMMLTYNLEPVYSILLAMLIFNEAAELNYSFYLGVTLIVVSVGLKTYRAIRLR